MIFKSQVQKIAEGFIRTTLTKYPRAVDALLSNPKLPEWYEKIASDLTVRTAMDPKLDARLEILRWATGYVQHVLKTLDEQERLQSKEI